MYYSVKLHLIFYCSTQVWPHVLITNPSSLTLFQPFSRTCHVSVHVIIFSLIYLYMHLSLSLFLSSLLLSTCVFMCVSLSLSVLLVSSLESCCLNTSKYVSMVSLSQPLSSQFFFALVCNTIFIVSLSHQCSLEL